MRKSVSLVFLVPVLAAILVVGYRLLAPKPEVTPKPDWPRRYAGIEIGTRGVRYAIVTIKRKSKDDSFEYEIEGWPAEIKYDGVFVLQGRIVKTEELKGAIRYIVDEKINPTKVPNKNIHIIAGNSYQNVLNMPDFLKELREAYPAFTVNALDVHDESLMELKTLKPLPAELDRILLIGIGSQTNRIAAYGGKNNVFAKPFDNGLQKLTQDVMKSAAIGQPDKRPVSSANRARELKKLKEATKKVLGPGGETDAMGRLLTQNPFRSMEVTVVTGGLPCAILESIGKVKETEFAGGRNGARTNFDRFKLIEKRDLDRFREIVEEKYLKFQEGEKLCGDFSLDELVVGSELFRLLYEKSSFENKTMYYFDRLTWIPGYLVHQAENGN